MLCGTTIVSQAHPTDSITVSVESFISFANSHKDCADELVRHKALVHQYQKKIRIAERKGELTKLEADYLRAELKAVRRANGFTLRKLVGRLGEYAVVAGATVVGTLVVVR